MKYSYWEVLSTRSRGESHLVLHVQHGTQYAMMFIEDLRVLPTLKRDFGLKTELSIRAH